MERTSKELLFKAVKENKIEKVRSYLLNDGADANVRDEKGNPVLIVAAIRSSQMLELFLAQPNIDVNIKGSNTGDYCARTALMVACHRGKSDAIRRLCQVPGIDLNCQDNSGSTAAFLAVTSRKLDCVQILKSVPGVDWNLKTEVFGMSPLSFAVCCSLTEILKVLLEIPNIDFNNIDKLRGATIGQLAVRSDEAGSLQCLELLCKDSRVDWNSRYSGDVPIMFALKNGKTEMFNILMNVPSIDSNVLRRQMDTVVVDYLKHHLKQVKSASVARNILSVINNIRGHWV